MNIFFTFRSVSLFCCLVLCFQSCIRKDYDIPPDNSQFDPKLSVTHSIAQIVDLPSGTVISEEMIIEGTVVMNDKNSNYFNKIVIQDASAGIEINIDQTNLYIEYPVGRKVYIKCKGLVVSNYAQNPHLGYSIDVSGATVSIPSEEINNFIVKANYPNKIVVDTFSYDQLVDPNVNKLLINKLIAIKNVAFAHQSLHQPYALAAGTTSRELVGCGAITTAKINLKTSNYASFHTSITPSGSGTIVGIYTRYNNFPQLYIRDTTDVLLNNERCAVSSGIIDTILNESFDNGTINTPINLTNWINYSESGNVKFLFAGNNDPYVKITAYGSGQVNVKSWLVLPMISLVGIYNPRLVFQSSYAYADNATLKAYITTQFNGDPLQSNWTQLPDVVLPNQSNWSWKDMNINLNSYVGQQVYIAFKYEGSASNGTGTFGIDDVKLIIEH